MRTILLAMMMASAALADITGTVTLNTSGLIFDPNGPFTLDFQLVENTASLNQVMLSDFSFGGGSMNTTPTSTTGGVTVDTSLPTVLLDGSSFLNDAQFAFTPGSTLGFSFDATANSDPAGTDTFTFAIFDQNGVAIPTVNSFFDVFVEIDLPSPGFPSGITLSGSDLTRTTIDVPTPVLASAPEPSGLMLLGTGLAGLFGTRALRRRRMARG